MKKKTSGTAGCIRDLIKKKISDNFIVINGDIFSKLNFSNMMQHHLIRKSDITVGITNYQVKLPYAVLHKRRNKNFFVEKPEIKKKINAGIYVVKKKYALKFFKKNNNKKINMTDLIDKSNNVSVYNIGKKWIDIGQIEDFKKANDQIKEW